MMKVMILHEKSGLSVRLVKDGNANFDFKKYEPLLQATELSNISTFSLEFIYSDGEWDRLIPV